MNGNEGLRTLAALMACLFYLRSTDKQETKAGMHRDRGETEDSSAFRRAAAEAWNMVLELEFG